ncbi:uncharacterized protein LOC117641872 [Thrips palmi]|uniref:Uncharacterized protein LOC117641872 n=1 Tax=Thrips palmi TaxID=161013 RepID=A0A6P8Y7B1_THRPL|nr:uncharacterized protein LOC117641872 [Thrips palmi]
MYEFYEAPINVLFNINTTGLSNSAAILQLAAKFKKSVFNAYVLPNRPIDPGAYAVNKFVCQDGQLFVDGMQKVPKPFYDAVADFLNFLSRLNGQVILVGHGAHNFHSYHLLKAVNAVGLLDNFRQICLGFVDTLPLFRELCPDAAGYRLEDLIDIFQVYVPNLNNSVNKCKALESVLVASQVTHNEVVSKLLQLDNLI